MLNGLVRNPMQRMISAFGRASDYLRGKHAARPMARLLFAIGFVQATNFEAPHPERPPSRVSNDGSENSA
jgi:hypothetical protein